MPTHMLRISVCAQIFATSVCLSLPICMHGGQFSQLVCLFHIILSICLDSFLRLLRYLAHTSKAYNKGNSQGERERILINSCNVFRITNNNFFPHILFHLRLVRQSINYCNARFRFLEPTHSSLCKSGKTHTHNKISTNSYTSCKLSCVGCKQG